MVRLAAGLALLLAGPSEAACRLALVLALDVSASVDARDYALQRDGLAAALNSDEVRHAILNGAPGDVALAVYEWSGRQKQSVVLDWTRLRAPGDIDRAVARLAAAERSEEAFPTAMGYGLGYGAGMLARAPDCRRRVLDLSGDGVNNDGFGPALAYRHFPFEGVTVNGLAVLGRDAEVLDFYRREVPRGPGSFVEVARGYEDFQAAMARKLYREIDDLVVGRLAAPAR